MSIAQSFNSLLSPNTSQLLSRAKRSDSFVDDSLDTFKDLLESKTSNISEESSASDAPEADSNPGLDIQENDLYWKAQMMEAQSGMFDFANTNGSSRSEGSVAMASRRWMSLEVRGDVDAFRSAVSEGEEHTFEGNISVELKYREHFAQLADYSMQYAMGDLFSYGDDEDEGSTSALHTPDWVRDIERWFGPEDQLTRMEDTMGDLFDIFEEDTDSDPDPKDLTDFRWMVQESMNFGLSMFEDKLSARKKEEEAIFDWIDINREQTGIKLAGFVNDVMDDLVKEKGLDSTETVSDPEPTDDEPSAGETAST